MEALVGVSDLGQGTGGKAVEEGSEVGLTGSDGGQMRASVALEAGAAGQEAVVDEKSGSLCHRAEWPTSSLDSPQV